MRASLILMFSCTLFACGQIPPSVRAQNPQPSPPRENTDARAVAEKIFAEADQLRKQNTPEAWRAALVKYDTVLPLWRKLEDRQRESQTLNALGQLHQFLHENEQAIKSFEQSIELNRASKNQRGEALALYGLGQTFYALDEDRKALEFYKQSLVLRRALGDRLEQGLCLNNIGAMHYLLGESHIALDFYKQALTIRRDLNDRFGIALTLYGIGVAHLSNGDNQKALDAYEQSLAVWREMKNRNGEADTLNAIGLIYAALNEHERALNYYDQALTLWTELKIPQRQAYTFNNMGMTRAALKDPRAAIDFYTRALALLRPANDRAAIAYVLRNLGAVYLEMNEPQKALDYLNESLMLNRALGNRYGEAFALDSLGQSHAALADKKQAQDFYEQALTLRRAIGDRNGEAVTLAQLARVERDAGDLKDARAHIEAALALIEASRSTLRSQELRASYFAAQHNYYEFYIDLLMRPDKVANESDAIAAVETSERARARSLLETLSEARADIRQGADAKLLAREEDLQRQVNAQTERLTRLGSANSPRRNEQTAEARKTLDALLNEYKELQAQIRASTPRYAALIVPRPLTLAEIQTRVLDEDTLLLEYALGEERSFLFAVTKHGMESFTLPKRIEVETLARRLYETLTERNRIPPNETLAQKNTRLTQADAAFNEAAHALSEMLIAPVAAQLKTKRLLVVTEGALQYVPFAALPTQVPSQRTSSNPQSTIRNPQSKDLELPLIVEHEIVRLPSASIVAVLRDDRGARQSANLGTFVVADPVFQSDDPRVRHDREASTSKTASTDDTAKGAATFARLPFSRQEAEGIIALASGKANRLATDFDANRAMVVRDELSRYRIVHFATHALVNNQRPELSGIVLSLVDEQGKPQNGFLRLYEIYNLQLNADLVVLSACQTALGKEIKGEGLIGLTRGFMYAGAPRVVASLWNVPDKATAELMRRFYANMVREKMPPSAALRAAQLSMWRDGRFTAPYNWAAFTIQGEWR